MEGNGQVVELLRNIWAEMKTLNGRVNGVKAGLDQVKEGLDQTNQRLDQTNQRLERLEQRVEGLAGETRNGFAALRAEMRDGFAFLGARIDNLLLGTHRDEHAETRARLDRIETQLHLPPLRTSAT